MHRPHHGAIDIEGQAICRLANLSAHANPGESAVITIVLSADGSDPGGQTETPPTKLTIRRAVDGSLVIGVAGPAGRTETLQFGEDLVNWTDGPAVQTQGENLPVEVAIAWPEGYPQRFIRARRSP